MAVTSQMKGLGDALIAWWAPQVSSLSIVSFDWAPQMQPQPSYPCKPRTECPRAFLRLFEFPHTYGSGNIGCTKQVFRYQVSLWYQRRQIGGQAHQELLVAAMDTFQQPLVTAKYDLGSAGFKVTGLTDLRVLPEDEVRTVIHDELEHPMGDPDMRVSSGELNFSLFGRIQA